MDLRQVTAVVLAGDLKCMKMVARTNMSYLTRALAVVSSLNFKDIIVVAHPAIPSLAPEFRRVQNGRSAFESVRAGIQVVTTEYVLILSTDLPFIDEGALKLFIQHSLESAAENDACVPLAQRSACAAEPFRAYGGHRIHIAGLDWKCGSVFFLRRDAWSQICDALKIILGLRKQPIHLIVYFLSNYRFVCTAIRYLLSHYLGIWSLNFSDVHYLLRSVLGVRCRLLAEGPSLVVDRD